jgi:hypothetical protein
MILFGIEVFVLLICLLFSFRSQRLERPIDMPELERVKDEI